MDYKLLTIVGATILFSGCGQTSVPLTREEMNIKEDMEQASFEAKMLAENGEPKFEELLKEAKKDVEGNIILTSQMRYAFHGCENIEPGFLSPNKTVPYVDGERGISFSIPYNSAWKFCGYALDEYDETPKRVYDYFTQWEMMEFGGLQLMPESGSNLARMYHLAYMPTSTPDKLMAEHRTSAFENDAGIEFKKIKINNLEVLKEVEEGGLCSSVSYYIFAEKNTFAFQGYCTNMSIGGKEYSQEQFSKELEQIIKTVKLI